MPLNEQDQLLALPELGARPVLLAGIVGCFVVATGPLGYMLIEDWSVLDSFYMTIITLTTVGYGEVQPLSSSGRLFTAALIIAGVGGATYFFSTLMGVVVEGELLRMRGFKKMRKELSNFSDHIIVCGCGRLGRIVVRELHEAGQDVVVIDVKDDAAQWLALNNIHYVVGTAYEDEILKAAGISRAKTLLSLLPQESDTVYVALSARDLNPELHIIARTEDESGENKLLRAGANQVLAPYRVTGTRIVQRLIRPHVSDFLEIAGGRFGHQLAIEEVVVPKDSVLSGKTLEQSDLRNRTGAVIAAFIHADGEMIFNPGAKSVIEPESTMIVMGKRESLERLSELL